MKYRLGLQQFSIWERLLSKESFVLCAFGEQDSLYLISLNYSKINLFQVLEVSSKISLVIPMTQISVEFLSPTDSTDVGPASASSNKVYLALPVGNGITRGSLGISFNISLFKHTNTALAVKIVLKNEPQT